MAPDKLHRQVAPLAFCCLTVAPPFQPAHPWHRSARKLTDPVCSAFVQGRVFERVRANMHECSRQRVCALMQEFRKHERGVLGATTGRGPSLQKIVEYSYGLRGQRKWAFHRAYNLAEHHNTVTGPPWPRAEYDERFGWRTEVQGQLMLLQTAAPLPLPLLEHLHEMMRSCSRAERRMYECIAHVPRTPLVPRPCLQRGEDGALPLACDQSLGISVGRADFSIVEVKRNRRSKVRFKRKTKIDRKFLTNGDLASVCKAFGRGLTDESGARGDAAQARQGGVGKVSLRAQLKDALLSLQKARSELQLLRAGEHMALPLQCASSIGSSGSRVHTAGYIPSTAAGIHAPSASSPSTTPAAPTAAMKRRAAPPHPLAVIPGTRQAAALRTASSAIARSHLTYSDSTPLPRT